MAMVIPNLTGQIPKKMELTPQISEWDQILQLWKQKHTYSASKRVSSQPAWIKFGVTDGKDAESDPTN